VRKKGLKYANIIEIQFYINQLKNILKDKFTSEIRNQFIKDAKTELQTQGELISKNIKKRKGLHQLAEKYLANSVSLAIEQELNREKTSPSIEGRKQDHAAQDNNQDADFSVGIKQAAQLAVHNNDNSALTKLFNVCIESKDWQNAMIVLLLMKPENLKDPNLAKSIQQPDIQQEIRKKYHLYLDELTLHDRHQRSTTVIDVLNKKNALGAILHPDIPSPFFGKKEIIEQKSMSIVNTSKKKNK
jgi:hypothetical protein